MGQVTCAVVSKALSFPCPTQSCWRRWTILPDNLQSLSWPPWNPWGMRRPCLPSHAHWAAFLSPAACCQCFLLLPREPGSPSNCVACAPCFKCKSIECHARSHKAWSQSRTPEVAQLSLWDVPGPMVGHSPPCCLPSSSASTLASQGEVLETHGAFPLWVATLLAWFREHHREKGKDGFCKFPCLTGLCGGAYHCTVHRQFPGVWAEASDPKPL